MITPRDAVEQAILVAVGAASLTRERAEVIVDELVRRGQLREDEGRAMVDRLMTRVRGEAAPAPGIRGKLEGGLQQVLRELGVVHRHELDEVVLRISELEHRVKLLEGGAGEDPAPAPEPPAA
ncbi:MAG: hypothetical protein MUE51_08935 [Thermoleophilia bacterium]|jgi:polyhydroxyalkanoate synthesis regulator phasin|nr:hypothetical protein [Thermoleophilia bacterium]